ncbi:MAG: universal stress protein [Bacteroidetes bacterium]|nr:universal stress protein [Bacteroidota bacterium]
MGTHGTSGVSEWLFGSNAFSVVNNTTIPVLTINFHSDSNTFKKIVFPFNENLLTLKKAEQVIALAKIFNASILIFGYTDSKMTSALTVLRKKGEELARQFKDENIESTFTMSLGEDYADEILEFANGEKADLITVITNRSHNVDKVFKTKPDKKLVNHSEIPVLSVPVG